MLIILQVSDTSEWWRHTKSIDKDLTLEMEHVYDRTELDAEESLMYLRDVRVRVNTQEAGIRVGLSLIVTSANVDELLEHLDVLLGQNVVSVCLNVRSGLERLDVLLRCNHKLVEISVDASVHAAM